MQWKLLLVFGVIALVSHFFGFRSSDTGLYSGLFFLAIGGLVFCYEYFIKKKSRH
jgi:hypothetical protein